MQQTTQRVCSNNADVNVERAYIGNKLNISMQLGLQSDTSLKWSYAGASQLELKETAVFFLSVSLI